MFPAHVRTVINDPQEAAQCVQAQGLNECGCTTPANALNLLYPGQRYYEKDQFVREAGIWFQRSLGGTPSFVTRDLLLRHGAGTHFGSLRRDHGGDAILCDLIDRGVPVCVELGANTVGPFTIYGEHSILLVGYSEPFTDPQGRKQQEYYFLDALICDAHGALDLARNNQDRDGDGIPEQYPGNRTMSRDDFWKSFPTGIYFPVFPSPADHRAWRAKHLRSEPRIPLWGWVQDYFLTGSADRWVGPA